MMIKTANAQDKTWCVAKPSSTDAELSANLEFACGHVDCTTIQPNGPCFNPNTFINHASVAMNLYYSFHGRNLWNCDYQKSGLITKTDPSYGTCQYA
ncbi:major pollen allergen Ole e 10-like [Populus alba x Populus x berolinensis]|uniref:Major pollen allergen Ole e 10-like n=1 Tax=Populus alba x Populus x berolinensis TaxID=444605 RepID=A0AAD6RU55_9ROSI|nr:major pollen allergen Ole e 10-like [Populus alba x Populus x berolinensis]